MSVRLACRDDLDPDTPHLEHVDERKRFGGHLVRSPHMGSNVFMAKHEQGDLECPDMHYWWDQTWTTFRVGRDRALAESKAHESAQALIARGEQRVRVSEIHPTDKDGFYAVKYSVYLTYHPKFHTCKCEA